MTMIISSQRYLDNQILNEKLAELEGAVEVILTAWDVKDYGAAVLCDGHHTHEAAQQLGLTVRFEIVEHPEGLSGDDLLEQAWIDSDWYNVKTGRLFF
jgi:hypothetical protein